MYTQRVDTENTEDSIGCYMTVTAFLGAVNDGVFTDYDGYGHPCLGDLMDPDTYVYASKTYTIPDTATHIVWFNK